MKKDINKIIIETYNKKIRNQDKMNKHAVLSSLGITNPGPHWNKETWDQEKVLADIRNSAKFKHNQTNKLSSTYLELLKRMNDSDEENSSWLK